MSLWKRYDVENDIRSILHDCPVIDIYQLTREYDRRFPLLRRQRGWTVGGKGSGEHYSLASYLAGKLSFNINNGDIQDIEYDPDTKTVRYSGPTGMSAPPGA